MITHIVRGEEYINSTPKYIQLYQAFGWQVPQHIHLPLILNKDRSKLSKREGNAGVENFIKAGYLRETMINFIYISGIYPPQHKFLQKDSLTFSP